MENPECKLLKLFGSRIVLKTAKEDLHFHENIHQGGGSSEPFTPSRKFTFDPEFIASTGELANEARTYRADCDYDPNKPIEVSEFSDDASDSGD